MSENKQSLPVIVESTRYHEYVPGDTSLHIPINHRKSLGIDTYSVPSTLNDGPTPCIDDYAIGCVYSGHAKGCCTLDGSIRFNREIYPGMAFIFEKHASVNWHWKPASTNTAPVKFINVFVPVDLINRTCLSALDAEPSTIEIPGNIAFNDPFMVQILMSLKAEAGNTSTIGTMFMDTAAQLLAIHLLNSYSLIKRPLPKVPSSFSRAQSNRIVDFINDNLAEDISLESLSSLTSYSNYHFAHMFKQTFGIGPNQYLIRHRIEKAKQLLKHSDMKIGLIALEVGYESQSHFTNLFRRIVGVTPKTYRDQV
jgi:AraC family transcriptional regulator